MAEDIGIPTEKFCVVKWRQSMAHRGWRRYEVRPDIEVSQDSDWSWVQRRLSFAEADAMCKRLNDKEERKSDGSV